MDDRSSIRLGKMFCPATDRNVPILFRHRHAEIDPGAISGPGDPISCLDYGVRCTGWLCPHFASPGVPPGNLLERALRLEQRRGGRGTSERRTLLERALRESVLESGRPGRGGGIVNRGGRGHPESRDPAP